MQLVGKGVGSVAMNLYSNYKKKKKKAFSRKTHHSERKVGLKWDRMELVGEFNGWSV